jgi:hypothetical protein
MLHKLFIYLTVAVALFFSAGLLKAQVVRLPPVVAEEVRPIRLASFPDSAADVILAPGEIDVVEDPDRPRDARPGMFQKIVFEGTWLAGGSGDNFGMSELEFETILALPIPSRKSPLIITPGFAAHYLHGPTSSDLPPRVYSAYTQFRWMHRLTPSLGIDLAITPGVFGDFEQSTADTFRMPGHGAAMWTWTPTLKVLLGVAYLDREDVPFLPIAGLIWQPRADVKYELTFPRPRIARRVYFWGACGDDVEDWIYVSGELGGGTWAIARTDGSDDIFNYRDYRLILGVQRKVLWGLDRRLEIGYIFGRKIEYQSPTPDIFPSDTVMIRGGLVY